VGLSSGVFLGGYGVPSICGTICILFRPYFTGMTFNNICQLKKNKKNRKPITRAMNGLTHDFGSARRLKSKKINQSRNHFLFLCKNNKF